MSRHYLSFDLSTQSCTCMYIKVPDKQEHSTTTALVSVNFDKDLPHYGTENGSPKNDLERAKGVVRCNALMWAEGIEECLKRLAEMDKVELDKVERIGGSAQMHASVYWGGETVWNYDEDCVDDSESEEQSDAVGREKTKTGLVKYLKNNLTTLLAPIWLDTSTSNSVKELENKFGWEWLTAVTGSRGYERFTGHQIKKMRRELKDGLKSKKSLNQVFLASNWCRSILCGRSSGVEVSDAGGMNLLDLRDRKWRKELGEFFFHDGGRKGDDDFRSLLGGEPVSVYDSDKDASQQHKVAPYFTDKYGLNENCIVSPFTGDNSAALVGMTCLGENSMDIVISLGTSDTLLMLLPEGYEPGEEARPFGHVFPHPLLKGRYYLMFCYSNGDILRKTVKGLDKSWQEFTDECEVGLRENRERGQLPLLTVIDEICPPVRLANRVLIREGSELPFIIENDHEPMMTPLECLEARAIQMCAHACKYGGYRIIGNNTTPIAVVGGGAKNDIFRKIISGVFGRKVIFSELNGYATLVGGLILGASYLDGEKNSLRSRLVELRRKTGEVETEWDLESCDFYQDLVDLYLKAEDELVRRFRWR